MSDDVLKGASKAAKKNKKRNLKKTSNCEKGDTTQRQDFSAMLAELKSQLEDAKADKDHKHAATLRNQIWVLTDIIAGVKTDIPDDELEKIMQSIETKFNPVKDTPPAEAKPVVPGDQTVSPAADIVDNRKLRNLHKKLEHIVALKERQQHGEKLEANQIEKIKSEDKIKEEIADLEDIMKGVQLRC